MSYTFLRDLVVESSVECYLGMFQCAPSSWKSIAGNPCFSASVTACSLGSPSGMTSQHLTESHGGGSWTLSVEDSLAKTFPRLEKVRELMGADPACGGKWLGLSVKWDQEESSWKTARCLWEEALPWSSVTLPAWGLMRGGECWELMTAELLTGEKESGFWPTPNCRPEKEGIDSVERRIERGDKVQISLIASVQKAENFWPTPATWGFAAVGQIQGLIRNCESIEEAEAMAGSFAKRVRDRWPTPQVADSNKATKRWRDDHQNNLTAAVFNWPTPVKSDSQNRRPTANWNGGDLPSQVWINEGGLEDPKKPPVKLNPDWVEWLMGWPIGWSSTEPITGPIQWAWDWWDVDPANSGEIPRANSGTAGRVSRLKAIGNGQVPACAAIAYLTLSGGQANG